MTIRTSILMGGMAAAIALTAGGAFAATTPLYGGGSTLVEKAYRDVFNTYGSTSSGDLCVGRTLCPTSAYNSGVELLYVGVGSGNGLKALDAHDPSLYITGPKTPDKVPVPSGRDFGAFYGAGTGSSWVPSGSATDFYPSVTFSGSDDTLDSKKDVPAIEALGFGPAIQLPGVTAAIAVPYHPTAGWNPQGGTVSGNPKSKVQLSINTICGIFTGAITKWSDPAITKDNKGHQLGTGTISVVYRNDGSGTTFLFTNALLNQCGTAAHKTKSTHPVPAQWLTDNKITANSTAPYYKSGTKFFINVFKAGHLPKNFYNDNNGFSGVTGGASGSGGLQKVINNTVGSIGYISPDFVQPVDTKAGPLAANIQTYATFKAGKTPVYVAPTAAAATAAMASALPPTGAAAADPTKWGAVEPTPAGPAAYPFSGFSFIDLYTCYKSEATVNALVATTGKYGYLTWYYGPSKVNGGTPDSILTKDGLAPVPTVWAQAATKLLTSPTLGPNVPGKGACVKITKGA